MTQQPQQAYADLVASCAPALLRLAVMLTGHAADAEDLLQATLVRAHKHADRIPTMATPLAYLRRIMVNEHTSHGRRLARRVRTVTGPVENYDLPSPPDSSVENRDEAWRWLATLPAKQRAVLVLRFYEDLPDAEIADLLGVSEGTVRSNASRALESLRAQLKEES